VPHSDDTPGAMSRPRRAGQLDYNILDGRLRIAGGFLFEIKQCLLSLILSQSIVQIVVVKWGLAHQIIHAYTQHIVVSVIPFHTLLLPNNLLE
jgi:hypothetical protein